jgi:DNA-binding Lrp family transcriptional regulator
VVEAYVLIETEIGKMGRVTEALRQAPGVIVADVLSGPYDVIVRAQAADMDGLGRLVVAQIQTIEGVTRTLTCPVVRL